MVEVSLLRNEGRRPLDPAIQKIGEIRGKPGIIRGIYGCWGMMTHGNQGIHTVSIQGYNTNISWHMVISIIE